MAAPKVPSLPRNLTSDIRVLYRLDEDSVVNVGVGRSLIDAPLELGYPMRAFYSWRGKRALEGHWYLETLDDHVGFESHLESQFLLWADWEPSVVGVSSQPLALLWPRDTPNRRHHVPDYFIREANGDGTVVDVRPTHFIDKDRDQFERTRDVCREIGWGYRVWPGLDAALRDGIAFVSGYRFARCAPSPEVRDALLGVYHDSVPLEQGLDWAAHRAHVSRAEVLSGLYHLVWKHELTMDMSRPLSLRTPVSKGAVA